MADEFRVIGSVVALGFGFVLLPIALMAYQRFARRLALRCPETGDQTAVKVDTWRAVRTSLFGEPRLSVRDCARWPEKRNCGQLCLDEAGSPSSTPATIQEKPHTPHQMSVE